MRRGYQLKAVSFRYHKEYDRTQTIAFGLIAEEVGEVKSRSRGAQSRSSTAVGQL